MSLALTTFDGNCHCGAYRFRAVLPEIKSAVSCSCSLCRKTGALWAYLGEGSLAVTHGDDSTLSSYSSHALTIKFCPICGSAVLGQHVAGPLMGRFGINVRSLIGVNPFKLEQEDSDGRASEQPPDISSAAFDYSAGPDLAADDGAKMYTGSCHCGLIRLALRTKPLPQAEIKEDNCSICVRNAWAGVYPRKAQVSLAGADNARDYLFGRKFGSQSFCRGCGVVVFQKLYGPPRHVVDAWPEARQEMYRRKMDVLPLNIRALDGVEWDELEIQRSDEGTDGYDIPSHDAAAGGT